MSKSTFPSSDEASPVFSLQDLRQGLLGLQSRLASQEEMMLFNRFNREAFARQQAQFNKSLEERLTKLLHTVEKLGPTPQDAPPPLAPTGGWQIPPSITTKPVKSAPDAWPKLKLEPPRFDGVNVTLWIERVQTFYNHSFTPLSDWLYLTEFLLDDAAAEWFSYWASNNGGKSWDDFLLDVQLRFDPNRHEFTMAATEEPVVDVLTVEEPVTEDNGPAFEELVIEDIQPPKSTKAISVAEEAVTESAIDQNREVTMSLFCGAGHVFGAVSGAVNHGAPELHPDLVSLSTVSSFTGLLNHDNTDIDIDAVTLLQDLTDVDVVTGNDESAQVLIDVLVENNDVELLVQNLSQFIDSDPDESTVIYNTLLTIENLVEVKPSVSELVCGKTKLLKWLQARIKIHEFDSNKQYVSEILAILLQNSSANHKRLGQMNGVDTLLQAVAMYTSKNTKMGDEEEMVENHVLHKFLLLKCLPVIHCEECACFDFFFGERYKVAYMSDISCFLPSTENYISNDGSMEQWLVHWSSAKSTHPLHILLLLRRYSSLCFAVISLIDTLRTRCFRWGGEMIRTLIRIISCLSEKRSQSTKFKDFILINYVIV